MDLIILTCDQFHFGRKQLKIFALSLNLVCSGGFNFILVKLNWCSTNVSCSIKLPAWLIVLSSVGVIVSLHLHPDYCISRHSKYNTNYPGVSKRRKANYKTVPPGPFRHLHLIICNTQLQNRNIVTAVGNSGSGVTLSVSTLTLFQNLSSYIRVQSKICSFFSLTILIDIPYIET